MIHVEKRDGRIVDFDRGKIETALCKSYLASHSEVDSDFKGYVEKVSGSIEDTLQSTTTPVSVETIQDMVEKKLMTSRYKGTAKDYILYRDKRTRARKNTIDDTVKEIIDGTSDYWSGENSNKDFHLVTTQRDYIAGAVSTDLTMRELLPDEVVEAHKEGILHFHDADYFITRLHNCFLSSTKFVTDDGVRTFKSCQDGETLKVLDKDGVWRQATVRYFGKRRMVDVTFQSGRSVKTVTCTPDHRWILNDGSVTSSLRVGMALYPLHPSFSYDLNHLTKEQARAFSVGFALGDGCDHGSRTYIRLCGHKVEYSPIFVKAGYRVTPNGYSNGDSYVVIHGAFKQDFLNSKSWRFMGSDLKKYLFLGYYKADGAVSSNRISTSDTRIVDMIEDISSLAGYYIASVTKEVRDTNFKNNSTLFTIRFRLKQNFNNLWKVKSIKPHSNTRVYDSWCVEEPVTHSFTLDGGIVTGNCCLINLEDMLENGTVISNVKIDRPHKFSTACNIATQVISQVASSQYGGQSITLSHLSPFIEVTRSTLRHKFPTFSDDQIEQLVKSDISAGVQTLQYQIITLMTTNGQAPFITVYLDLSEVPEGTGRDDLAIAIEEVLKQRIQGVKNQQGVYITPAFPKLIYALDDCNIHEDSKYWYLTKLAAECSAKRMVPDYISNKVQRKLKNGDEYPCINITVPFKSNLNSKTYLNGESL
jgi:hypothetical protein